MLKAEEALVVHALCRNLLEHKTTLISFGWQFIGYCITLTFGAREAKSLWSIWWAHFVAQEAPIHSLYAPSRHKKAKFKQMRQGAQCSGVTFYNSAEIIPTYIYNIPKCATFISSDETQERKVEANAAGSSMQWSHRHFRLWSPTIQRTTPVRSL